MASIQVSQYVGSELHKSLRQSGVDIAVLCGDSEDYAAFVHVDRSQARAACQWSINGRGRYPLLSGGIDSPVASG